MVWADILTGLQSLYDLEFSLNFFLYFILIWKFEIQFASLEMTWAEFFNTLDFGNKFVKF